MPALVAPAVWPRSHKRQSHISRGLSEVYGGCRLSKDRFIPKVKSCHLVLAELAASQFSSRRKIKIYSLKHIFHYSDLDMIGLEVASERQIMLEGKTRDGEKAEHTR